MLKHQLLSNCELQLQTDDPDADVILVKNDSVLSEIENAAVNVTKLSNNSNYSFKVEELQENELSSLVEDLEPPINLDSPKVYSTIFLTMKWWISSA